jgi:uncharacterized membrane protein YuzA (DUF378 family)
MEVYMSVIRKIALVILIIGALNWGLIGLFDFNLVAFLFDGISVIISRVIYSLVGVAAIASIVTWAIPEVEDSMSYTQKMNN